MEEGKVMSFYKYECKDCGAVFYISREDDNDNAIDCCPYCKSDREEIDYPIALDKDYCVEIGKRHEQLEKF